MIISVKDLAEIRKKNNGKTIVFGGGVFDVFHPGHIRAFKNWRAQGDVVVVGIASDKRVRELKGPHRPILSQQERREIVDAIRYVDCVVQMPESTKSVPVPGMAILEKLRPDIFISVDKGWIKHREAITALGIKLKIVGKGHRISSTAIIERIRHKYKR